jgi:hypothetical protein
MPYPEFDMLPEWMDMGDGEQQNFNISPLIGALRKRMATKPKGDLGTSLSSAVSNPNNETSYSGMLSDSIKAPAKGMKSL